MKSASIITVFLVLVFRGILSAGPPDLAPTQGVLVLRNGQVIHGAITKEGNRYLVALDLGGEIRLSTASVDLVCKSIKQAYVIKKSRLSTRNADAHLDLAQWCLRHELLACAADQLLDAAAADPKNPRLKTLQRRLVFATSEKETKSPPADLRSGADQNRTESGPDVVSVAELEKRIEELPEVVVERFTVQVQPYLVNRCAAAACHGVRAKTQYKLIRPSRGSTLSRRVTQRNLLATLEQARTSPASDTPLLKAFLEPHGNAEPKDAEVAAWRYERMKAWVELSRSRPSTKPQPSLRRSGLNLLNTVDQSPNASQPVPSGFRGWGENLRLLYGDSKQEANKGFRRSAREDPFDAGVFNRQHFGSTGDR